MERLLFVYGTLCDPDMLAAVIGRSTDQRNVAPAVAPGFRAVHYPDRSYPALVRAPGASAHGLVIVGFSAQDMAVLDAFEGEEYRRGRVPVMIDLELHEAEAYLPTATVSPDETPWFLGDWQAKHKAAVLDAEATTAARIRSALSARRPRRS